MRCIILALTMGQGRQWLEWVENQHEGWRAQICLEAKEAYALLCREYHEVCLLCPCPEAHSLEKTLHERPPVAPPWMILAGAPLPTGMPPGVVQVLPGLNCLSRALLQALTVKPGLRAWDYLPDMAALCAAHPPLMEDLRGRLYPLTARRHGTTPAAVERSLRTLVEATWTSGSLEALERFFGHSVDPEKGKPTNKEFLCRLQERLTLAARRLV